MPLSVCLHVAHRQALMDFRVTLTFNGMRHDFPTFRKETTTPLMPYFQRAKQLLNMDHLPISCS